MVLLRAPGKCGWFSQNHGLLEWVELERTFESSCSTPCHGIGVFSGIIVFAELEVTTATDSQPGAEFPALQG